MSTEQTDIIVAQPTQAATRHQSAMWHSDTWDHIQRVAKAFSASALVPKHFQGKLADVVIALALAHDLGENPLTFMQSVHIVHGVAGYSSKWLIGKVNASRAFRGRMRFRIVEGPKPLPGGFRDLSVTAYATDAETGDVIEETVTMQQAIDEKWTSNPKYKTMPEVMLRYRAATFFVRFNCPELLYGMPTAEELEDVTPSEAPRREPKGTLSALTLEADPEPLDTDTDGDTEHVEVVEVERERAAKPETQRRERPTIMDMP